MSFFCLWIAQFPAWALARSEPALQNRPFVVSEKGGVVSASRQALEWGVTVGMSDGRAQSCSENIQIVARDHSLEIAAWNDIQRALYNLTPKSESITRGLLFADVDSPKVAHLVHEWNAQGGNGTDRSTARLAALVAPPQKVRSIKRGHEDSMADRIPLEALMEAGLSPSTLERLRWFGYRSVGSLRPLDRRQIEEQFCPEGAMLYSLSQGRRQAANLRPVPLWTPPEELEAHLSFEFPATEPGEWEPALDHLLTDLCTALGSRSAHSIEVIADTAVNPVKARRLLKEPISVARKLQLPARAALQDALQSLAPLRPVVTRLEVRLGSLVSAPVQASLWDEAASASDPATRSKRWKRAVENVEARFKGAGGHSVMGLWMPQDPYAPFHENKWAWKPALEALACPAATRAVG